jgi:hypothetical protein
MKIVDYALAGGLVLSLLAAFWVLQGAVEKIKDKRLKKNGQRVIETVVRLIEHLSDTELEIGEQKLEVEYEINGKKKSAYSKTSSYGWDSWIGKKLAVWHFPGKSDGARLELDMSSVISIWIRLILLAVAVSVFAYGIWG